MQYANKKYIPFQPVKMTNREWPDKVITKAPVWCSVDLRDGNQALVTPMQLDEKLLMFKTLVDIGFKEIEVGFPSASDTEYEILRTLIEGNYIPDDVTVQVLVQARAELIKKTFEAVKGAKNVIIHFYNSTSTLQRKVVFKKDMDGIVDIAVEGARLIRKLTEEEVAKSGMNIRYEYSPESFTGTEIDFSIRICEEVMRELGATKENPVILNLPSTVEMSTPNTYADQIEYFCKNLHNREAAIVSIHPHNDRGTAVASAELAIMAGAERVEGTLFGNGERTGNLDLVTVALNMFTQGVDPQLDFSNILEIKNIYEKCTKMHVHERQPYAGELAFTAFSGSHQDAIRKGYDYMENSKTPYWEVPYLPINPADVNREYEPVIRINSQSGKGGVNYILKQSHGINLPQKMREEVGYLVKDVSDKAHKELTPDWVYQIFSDNYINTKPVFHIDECHFKQVDGITAEATINHGGERRVITATGNGRLDAVSNAIKQYFNISYELTFYEEHSLTKGSSSKAVAYVGVICKGKTFWGTGIDPDIIKASIEALTVAVNKIDEIGSAKACKDERMLEIMNYIQANYIDVTLDDLAERFYLSKPYISKYIKEKSGMTFGELVKKIRMKKAKALLKSSNMTVENIALTVGYQNVEHFNRLFKKAYQMTPMQYRNQK